MEIKNCTKVNAIYKCTKSLDPILLDPLSGIIFRLRLTSKAYNSGIFRKFLFGIS